MLQNYCGRSLVPRIVFWGSGFGVAGLGVAGFGVFVVGFGVFVVTTGVGCVVMGDLVITGVGAVFELSGLALVTTSEFELLPESVFATAGVASGVAVAEGLGSGVGVFVTVVVPP